MHNFTPAPKITVHRAKSNFKLSNTGTGSTKHSWANLVLQDSFHSLGGLLCRSRVALSAGTPLPNLLINIDHVATLRNARRESFPDPVEVALECEKAGADGIVFHLREDRRHISDQDVENLKMEIHTKLDFELSLAPEIVTICCRTVPHLATLVPERREEVTTEGGLDVVGQLEQVGDAVKRLFESGIQEVALFLDPSLDQMDAAAESGANAIELHTGDYANARSQETRESELDALAAAANRAHKNGLHVHAGHGLDYENFPLFIERVPHVREVSIGFAVIAKSIFVGIPSAVKQMILVVKKDVR